MRPRIRFRAQDSKGSDLSSGGQSVAVLDVDLADPVPSLPEPAPGLSRPGSADVLVRLHGHVLGLLKCQTVEGALPAARLAEEIWQAFSGVVVDHLRRDGLPGPAALPVGGLGAATAVACPSRPALEVTPLVTVVIPTYDRPERLLPCVESVLRQSYPHLEVVVVDNAPHRPPTAVAERFADDPRVRFLTQPVPGTSAARNRGLEAARGEMVAFLDDDVVADRGWLEAVVRSFLADTQVRVVTGLILPAELETAAQLWMEQYGGFNKGYAERKYDLAEHQDPSPLYPFLPGRFGSGANMAFRTDDLRAVGGFDLALGPATPTFGGEDIDVLLTLVRSGRRLLYQPDALVWHYHRREAVDVARQIYRYGVGLGAVLAKHGLHDRRGAAAILRRVPSGVTFLLSSESDKNAAKVGRNYPARLTAAELAGLGMGPVALLRSRHTAGSRVLATRGAN